MKRLNQTRCTAPAAPAAAAVKARPWAPRLTSVRALPGAERPADARAGSWGLHQPAASQYLGRLHATAFVSRHHSGPMIRDRHTNPDVIAIVDALAKIFCPPPPDAAKQLTRRHAARLPVAA